MRKKLPLLLFVISTMVLLVLVLFIDSANVSFFDSWFYNETVERMNPSLTMIMRFITTSGSTVAVFLICLSLFLFAKTREKWAFPVAISVIVASVSNVFLKTIFARERPNILRLVDESDYSFPSGHSMINMALYMMLLQLTWKYIKNKRLKYVSSTLYVIMPLAIGFSRIYLGVHYATDVLVGWMLGFILAIVLFDLFYQKKNEVKI